MKGKFGVELERALKEHRADPIQRLINIIIGAVFIISVIILFCLPFLLKVGQ